MFRTLTALLVLILVACGGGAGDGATPSPALAALFPISAQSSGDEFEFAIEKTVVGSIGPVVRQLIRSFYLGRKVEPSGPDLHTVSSSNGPGVGAGFMWTNRGLELTAYGSMQLGGAGGLCITATSPGLLVVPADFQRGDTHQCSLPGVADLARIAWVGAGSIPGYPAAECFEFLVTGPHSNSSPFSDRFGSTRYEVDGTVYLAPNIGPVSGTITQRYFDGPVQLQSRSYEFARQGGGPAPAPVHMFKAPLSAGTWNITAGPNEIHLSPAHQGENHYSVDIAGAGPSIPVYAMHGGQVYEVGTDAMHANGYFVRVDLDADGDPSTGLTTVYAHLRDPPLVSTGNFIGEGAQLGYMGSTSNQPIGQHLHITLRYDGDGTDGNAFIESQVRIEGKQVEELLGGTSLTSTR